MHNYPTNTVSGSGQDLAEHGGMEKLTDYQWGGRLHTSAPPQRCAPGIGKLWYSGSSADSSHSCSTVHIRIVNIYI